MVAPLTGSYRVGRAATLVWFVATVEEAGRLAAGTALSGPAGGVAAAAALSRAGAGRALVTFDMGGTSTDIALVRDGAAAMAGARDVGAARIALPSLDITTLGAGGGSIAAVGPGGLLHVGPRSAGAVPGPRHEDVDGVAAYRSGLELVREVVGPDVQLVGCGAPLLPSVGLVDAMRVSPDTFHEGGEDGSTGLRGLMPLAARGTYGPWTVRPGPEGTSER